jgi:type II secretory pathway pseudopilin PulG
MLTSNYSIKRPPNAGIAIGPILFIVAILGILAAAIAAGSGSFTAGSNTEKNRSNAAAIIQIGQNLKVGFDRITGYGTIHTAVVIDVNNTTSDADLFSPSGGGIALPSAALANTPGTDVWYYVNGAVPKFGTTSTERIATLRVPSGVCDQINNKANGIATPAQIDVGDFTNQGLALAGAASWPASLQGKPIGCINSGNSGATGYWFYQVLGIQ